MAVNLNTTNVIWLSEGPFAVLYGNACDGNGGAKFQLPAGGYSIWARAVGQPNTSTTITPRAVDPTTNTVICSTNNTVLARGGGSSKFKNVTTDLTVLNVILNGMQTSVPLFSTTLSNYMWAVDTTGHPHAQLRFYAD